MTYIPQETDIIVDADNRRLVIKDQQDPAHYWQISVDDQGTLITTDLGIQ